MKKLQSTFERPLGLSILALMGTLLIPACGGDNTGATEIEESRVAPDAAVSNDSGAGSNTEANIDSGAGGNTEANTDSGAGSNTEANNDSGPTIDSGASGQGGRGLAYCTELTVKVDGATIIPKGVGGPAADHLSMGDLVIRTFTKEPFLGKYEVDYLDKAGMIRRGEISKEDVIDRCPATASTAYYVTSATEFVSDLGRPAASVCSLTPAQTLRVREYAFDTRVSRTHAKLKLDVGLPQCGLMEGFVARDSIAFVISYESDTPNVPVLAPTRKPQTTGLPDAGSGDGDVTPPDAGPRDAGPDTMPDSEPNPGLNRCSMRERYVTLDGNDAFYFYDDDSRSDALKKLIDAGVCAGHKRIGVRGEYVTIDGIDAFYSYDVSNRLDLLLRLVQANVADKLDRCGATTDYVTVDGKQSFYVYNTSDRANLLIELIRSGVCSASKRLGVTSEYVTIDGQESFYVYNKNDRLALFVRLMNAGVAQTADRCGAKSDYVTIDGNESFYVYNKNDRVNMLIALTRGNACSTSHRFGASGEYITIDGINAFYFNNAVTRSQQLLRLVAAGAAKNGSRCAVSGEAITKDGKVIVTVYDNMKRVDRFIELEQSGICTP